MFEELILNNVRRQIKVRKGRNTLEKSPLINYLSGFKIDADDSLIDVVKESLVFRSVILHYQITLLIVGTITTIVIWCGFQFVDIERTTVAYLYICIIWTTVSRVAETHFPSDHPVIKWRMTFL